MVFYLSQDVNVKQKYIVVDICIMWELRIRNERRTTKFGEIIL
jgi:hypothetical protein